jgi:NitT/TauT family transport system substrate-binding protein
VIRRTRLLMVATSVAALALAAACGSSDDDNASTTGGGGGEKIVIGYSAWPGWFPWRVAEEQGLFAKNGVNVEMKWFDSYTESLNALSTGNLDANSQTLNDTLSSVSGGSQQKIVLVNDNSTGNDQIIAQEGINTIADLKGKKVAAEEGTVDHYLLLLALEQAGLSADDITFTPLLTDAAAAAFVAGKVDAVGVFAPFTTTALERKGSKAITTSANFPGAIPDHLVFTAKFVESRPDDVQAIVKTWFDTLKWIAANKDAANQIMAKRAGVSVADYETYDKGTTIFSLAQNVEAFQSGSTPANLDFQGEKIADFLVDTGLIDKKPPLGGLLDARFIEKISP